MHSSIAEQPRTQYFTDTWGGKNYACYPIHTEGKSLKEKLDASKLWLCIKSESDIDERNDNQCDIHRGSKFTYKHIESNKIINVTMEKSRSGKTIKWTFFLYFDGNIEF